MTDQIVYDTLNQPVDGSAYAIKSSTSGFSFMTASAAPGSLSDVMVSLRATNPGGASSIDVSLYSSSGTNPGQKLADLGSIPENSVTRTSAVFDIKPSTQYVLTSNTRYWVVLSDAGSGGSKPGIDYEAADAGSGSQGQYYSDGPTGYSNTSGADIARVTENVACFAEGTRMRTPHGDVAVEALVAGDCVDTSSGEKREVRWVGHRTTDCRRHARPNDVLPIRIAAEAFGVDRPCRDLYVSPGHAICVDVMGEVLIPAGLLVNGATITQEEVDEVTYWHVELAEHDIVLVENLPAESYLEMGNRGFFAESAVVALDAVCDAALVSQADYCRPLHAGGALVEAVRARLAVRAREIGRHIGENPRHGGVDERREVRLAR